MPRPDDRDVGLAPPAAELGGLYDGELRSLTRDFEGLIELDACDPRTPDAVRDFGRLVLQAAERLKRGHGKTGTLRLPMAERVLILRDRLRPGSIDFYAGLPTLPQVAEPSEGSIVVKITGPNRLATDTATAELSEPDELFCAGLFMRLNCWLAAKEIKMYGLKSHGSRQADVMAFKTAMDGLDMRLALLCGNVSPTQRLGSGSTSVYRLNPLLVFVDDRH